MVKIVLLVCLFALGTVRGYQKCHGHPRRYNGKQCASTTNYSDGHKGACGCGPASNDNMFDWNRRMYTTAPSNNVFGEGKTWCGNNCGKCIRLTATGGFVDGQGGPAREGSSAVFMITNLCPNVWPNTQWCGQEHNGQTNSHGYNAHFDLENAVGQVTNSLHWNNPEVTWEWTSCGGGNTPSNGQYGSCQCAHQGK